uniref:Uncharacterized protein n=1 Tax=viral metagenome TaxID=1070528 RepID=A0A6H2A0W5_9ZZZZ
MVLLTFRHGRDVFVKNQFKSWIPKLFGPNVKFDGCRYGNNYPVLRVGTIDFLKVKDEIPTRGLVSIEGQFDLLHQLSLGLRDFKNEI